MACTMHIFCAGPNWKNNCQINWPSRFKLGFLSLSGLLENCILISDWSIQLKAANAAQLILIEILIFLDEWSGFYTHAHRPIKRFSCHLWHCARITLLFELQWNFKQIPQKPIWNHQEQELKKRLPLDLIWIIHHS